ncbi:hypothetical protein ACS0TY_004586 [Phlomoides rotata]
MLRIYTFDLLCNEVLPVVTDLCATPDGSLLAVAIQRGNTVEMQPFYPNSLCFQRETFISTSIWAATSVLMLWMVMGASSLQSNDSSLLARVRIVSGFGSESVALEDREVPGGELLLQALQGKLSIVFATLALFINRKRTHPKALKSLGSRQDSLRSLPIDSVQGGLFKHGLHINEWTWQPSYVSIQLFPRHQDMIHAQTKHPRRAKGASRQCHWNGPWTMGRLQDPHQAPKFGGLQGGPPHRPFLLDELKVATNSFDNSTLMGEGSTGKVPNKLFFYHK